MVTSLDWERLSIARKSLLPGRGFFIRDTESDTPSDEELTEATVIAIADRDADGLTSAAIVRAVHGELTLVPTEPRSFQYHLETVAERIGDPDAIYILDLSIEDLEPVSEAITTIVKASNKVCWYDHHEWNHETVEAVESSGVDLEIGDSDEVSTADVALTALGLDEDEQWSDLVEVVRDHDLWLRKDPRSDDLADYAHWSDSLEYIETVSEHGADLPDAVMADLTERRKEKQALIDAAVARAELRSIGEFSIGITYGRCSQNEVAEAMRQAGADAAVVIKPSGGVSLRGTETFTRCHEVAELLGGGGHPKAAGCKPDVYHDMLDYAHHWTTQGATARHAIIQAFETVIESSD